MRVAVPRLVESLQRATEPLVLALDDVHALNDQESLDVVAAIAGGLPQGSQLALAARREPSIRLGRLRANRELMELRATDLAFTDPEAAELLAACGLTLHPDSVKVLVERTEGWPAALYLAALSLQGADDADHAAREFAGDQRMVADYLRDELISTLDPRQLDFLTRTSILDEVSGDVCDAVLQTEGSAEVLRELARGNALVTAIDARDRGFRYHALLREMLAAELRRRDPREGAALHARASAWYRDRGDFDRAVPHAIDSEDLPVAAELIWTQTANYASVGREATLERWLSRFTAPQVDGSVPLCLTRATIGMTAGNGTEVEYWTTQALALLDSGATPVAEAEALRLATQTIRAAGSAREGVVRMGADAATAYKTLPEDAPWRVLCRFVEGASLQLTGDRAGARHALEDGIRRGAVRVPTVHALCLVQLALVELDEGDTAEASRLTAAALERTEINAMADQPTMALTFGVGALVCARVGDSAAASRHAKRATRLLGVLNEISPWYEAEARIVIARALAQLDDVAGARAQLADAGRRLRQTPDAVVLREWLEEAWKEADTATVADRWPLTPAELRLLHKLPTHLSFREIAEESFVSANTVKTQARSIYRKLGVSSRAEAVACARTAGLLEESAITRIE
jgi:LuxR family maltose regulon positive regulatory protein